MLSNERKKYLTSLFPGREIEGFDSRNRYDIIRLKVRGTLRGALNATMNVWVKQ